MIESRSMVMNYGMWNIIKRAVVLCILSAAVLNAGKESVDFNGVNLGGYGYWEFGQIVRGEDYGGKMDHQWTNRALLGVSLQANPSERLRLALSPEFKLYYPYPERRTAPVTQRPNNVAYINEMLGTYSIGDLERPLLQLSVGMFTYKYNPEVRNLGEYLFRTGTYPPYVITDFDFPMARLLGGRLTTRAVDNLRADILFTSEYQYYPLYDFSLTGIADYTIAGILNVGGGVMLARMFPADSKKTEPTDPLMYDNAQYITTDGDTAYYTFKATKLMGRISLDPKGLFPDLNIFGEVDLKLYAEAAVIGLKDHKVMPDSVFPRPEYYGNILRRVPVMFGFNVPAFKVLDVLSVELEYFASGLPNDYRRVLYENIPVPNITDPSSYSPGNYKELKWRWSFYAKKEVINGFSLTGQVAYDHLRTTFQDGSTTNDEALHEKGHWYWIVKTGYEF
jgi:hypothetical protein